MSPAAAIRSVPSLAARHATTSAHSGKHKVVVIGAGAGGLAAANQIYNAFKSRGEALNDGDIAIIDVSYHT
jgi:malic enzyme